VLGIVGEGGDQVSVARFIAAQTTFYGSSEMSVQRCLADIRGGVRVVELRWGLGG
jgi:hypothetical protein